MTQVLRVAMVAACPFPLHRGSPIRIQRLAGALTSVGVEVEVVTYHLGRPETNPPYRVTRIPRVPTYRFEEPGPRIQKLAVVDPLLWWKLRRVLARGDFDVVHAHHCEGLAVALAARPTPDLPIVYDAHTLLGSELPTYAPRPIRALMRRIGGRIDASLPRRADHVIAVSERIRTTLCRDGGIAPERIDVVASGVEADIFPRRDSAPERGDAPVIVYAGGLAPFHGIDLMLRGFREVLRSIPKASLWILTDSSFDSYEPLAETLGIRPHIRLQPAHLDQLANLLSQADVAVNPRVDGSGIPQKLLNYMAIGLPIVSFAGSAPTLADGETGLVVEDGNLPAFARAIVKLVSEPELANRLGNAAAEKGRYLYTWENAACRVREIYERLVANQRNRRAGDQ